METQNQKNQNSLSIFLNNYFNIITVVIVVIVLGFAYFYFIKPKYDATMVVIRANIEQQQKLYTEQKKKLDNLNSVSNLYKKIASADLKKFNGILPDNYTQERLYGELEEIVAANGFVLDSIEIFKVDKKDASPDETEPTTASAKIGTINLQMNVSAIDYNGFKNLLRVLENNSRLFDVVNVSFSPESNSAVLDLNTYYYKK